MNTLLSGRENLLSKAAENLPKIGKTLGRVAIQTGAGLTAALLARMSIFGSSPFGAAFVAGISDRYAFAAFLGFFFSAAVGTSGIGDYTAIGAAGVSISLRMILFSLSGSEKKRGTLLPCAFAATLASLFTRSFAAFLTGGLRLSVAVQITAESCVIGLLALAFRFPTDSIGKSVYFPDLSSSHKICMLVSFTCVFAALCGISVGPLVIGQLLGALFIAYAGFSLPASCALPTATAAAAAVLLTDGRNAFAAAGLLIAMSFSSAFKVHGRAYYCMAFLICSCAFAFCADNYLRALSYLCETSCACLIFALLPLRDGFQTFSRAYAQQRSAVLCIQERLHEIGGAMGDVVSVLNRISERPHAAAFFDEMYRGCSERVCKNCPLMSYCWIKSYDETNRALRAITPLLREKSTISKEDLPSPLSIRCVNAAALCEEINRRYAEFIQSEKIGSKARLYRGILKRQFAAFSEMLFDCGEELALSTEWDERAENAVLYAAEALGLRPKDICCIRNSDNRLMIRLSIRENIPEGTVSQLSRRIEKILGSKLSLCGREKTEEGLLIRFREKRHFKIESTALQSSALREVCGDIYSIFEDGAGRLHAVLSDGMGTGIDAAKDGAVCCAFMRILMESGFPALRAAQLANTTLAVKDDRETACTIDALSVNLYSGEASLFKAGAAPTIVVSGGNILRYSASTLPVGILGDVAGKEFRFSLGEGDIVVMMSDGVPEELQLLVEKQLSEGTSDLQSLAACIGAALIPESISDDATVILARLCADDSSFQNGKPML